MNDFTLTLPVEIPAHRVAGLICTAMEQGSGYWARAVDESDIRGDVSDMRPEDDYIPRYYYTLLRDDWTDFQTIDDDKKRYRLNRQAIDKGLQAMVDKYPHHFSNFMSESDDAETADVFLQCCLFGEIVYG